MIVNLTIMLEPPLSSGLNMITATTNMPLLDVYASSITDALRASFDEIVEHNSNALVKDLSVTCFTQDDEVWDECITIFNDNGIEFPTRPMVPPVKEYTLILEEDDGDDPKYQIVLYCGPLYNKAVYIMDRLEQTRRDADLHYVLYISDGTNKQYYGDPPLA